MHGSRVQRLSQPVDLLALHAQQPQRYPFLLESTSGPSVEISPQGRYDLLFAFPTASLSLDADGQLRASGFMPEGNDFLANLDCWFDQEALTTTDELPFQGGWFLYLGYELAGQVEPILKLPMTPPGLP
ncbi:MAG: aminodeoxychorismate synthase component I, partial [Nevskiales bacterium]